MTWREKVVIRILLLIARIVSEDKVVQTELDKLATHIYVAPKLEQAA